MQLRRVPVENEAQESSPRQSGNRGSREAFHSGFAEQVTSPTDVRTGAITEPRFEGIRRRVRQEGSEILLNNALRPAGATINSGHRVFREPVIGAGLLLLGLVWSAMTLVMARLAEAPRSLTEVVGGVAFGLVFALVGYGLLSYQDLFTVNNATGQWRHVRGCFPFQRRRSGSLSEAECLRVVRQTRTASSRHAPREYPAWAAQILWKDAAVPPLTLFALDLDASFVTRDAALAACRWYGSLIGLVVNDAPADETSEAIVRGA
jgi:hypothetical protein